MRLRSLAVVLLVAALPAFAANVSGKWILTRQGSPEGRGGPGGGGRGGAPMVITLNQVGNELSGSVGQGRGNASGSPGNQELLGGKVEGETVSFYMWTGSDRPVRTFYTGKINGEEILFSVTVDSAAQGGNAPAPFQMIAKRTR